MKPGAYCRLDAALSTMPGTGCICSMTQVAPEDLAMTLVNICGSTPNASPMRKASATAMTAEPEIKLLHSLATSPDPTAPTWMMLPPIAARAGRASSRSPASPPTMIANVPAVAPPTPPDTGASRNRRPRSLSRAATRCEVPGSIVDMSTQSRPPPALSTILPPPRYTASTLAEDGSIVITRSQLAAASPTDRARSAPSLTAASSAPGTTSKATTSKPFLTRLASIGCPIVPVPINPTFMAVLSSNHQIAAVDRDGAAGHPASLVGGEKEDSADDILGLSHTAEQDLRDRRTAPFGVRVAGAGQPGQSRAGGDRIDTDAVRRQFERHRMGQRPAAAFGGDIGGPLGAG